MKILKVIHGYPMRYNAGSEVYSQMLCQGLAEHHEVHVFSRIEDSFAPFSHFLLNYNKDFEAFGTEGASVFKDHQSKLELDNINLLYVALTRAVEQLYIVGNASVSSKGEENLKTYSGLLINYLKSSGMWEDTKLEYEFGALEKTAPSKTTK